MSELIPFKTHDDHHRSDADLELLPGALSTISPFILFTLNSTSSKDELRKEAFCIQLIHSSSVSQLSSLFHTKNKSSKMMAMTVMKILNIRSVFFQS